MPPSTSSRLPDFLLLRRSPALPTLAAATLGAGLFYNCFITQAHAQAPPPLEGKKPPKTVFGAGPAFARLKLVKGEMVSGDTKVLRFGFPEGEMVSGLGLTSAVLTFCWPKGHWFPVLRPYTPISKLDEPGHLTLLVKKYPNGRASTHIHSLVPGDTLLFITAIPGYNWSKNHPLPPPSPFQPSPQPSLTSKPTSKSDSPKIAPLNTTNEYITLIAGGLGITPIFQLLQGILSPHSTPNPTTTATTTTAPPTPGKITLIWGVNTPTDILPIISSKLEAYERQFPGRFKAVYAVSNPRATSTTTPTTDTTGADTKPSYRVGYLTADLLKEVMPPQTGTETEAQEGKKAETVFLCGPPAMEAVLTGKNGTVGILGVLGYGKGDIFKF